MDGWPLYIFGIKRALVRDECPKELAWRYFHGKDIFGVFMWADLGAVWWAFVFMIGVGELLFVSEWEGSCLGMSISVESLGALCGLLLFV